MMQPKITEVGPVGAPPKDGAVDRRTLVEEGTELRGSLTSTYPVEVRGRIQGDLTAPVLVVSPTGSVAGHVKAGEVRSAGELAGEIDADVVAVAGVVKDNTVIRARSLDVKLAADEGKVQVVFGDCRLEVSPGASTPERTSGAEAAGPSVPSAPSPEPSALPSEPNGI